MATARDYYESGLMHGIAMGRRQIEDEIAERNRVAVERGLTALACQRAGVVFGIGGEDTAVDGGRP